MGLTKSIATLAIAVIAMGALTAEVFAKGKNADAGFVACGNWCLDHNRTPASQGKCVDNCCAYYHMTCLPGPMRNES